MSSAVLVGPSQDESTLLDEDEYRTLKDVLELCRGLDCRETAAILSALRAYRGNLIPGGTAIASFFAYLMADLSPDMDEVQGILVQAGKEPSFMRDEEGEQQAVALQAFLKILQSRNWLADFFIPVRIEKYAENPPTPLKVMRDLTESAEMFQSYVADAKRMMREWPEFFPGQNVKTAEPREANESLQAAEPSDDRTDYALNEYDAEGNLARVIWMSRDQYRDVKKTLVDQGCEIVDEAAQTTAAGKG
jgi:hypothetical protein